MRVRVVGSQGDALYSGQIGSEDAEAGMNPEMHSTALATAAAGLVRTKHCAHVRCCSDDIGQSLTPEQQHKGI